MLFEISQILGFSFFWSLYNDMLDYCRVRMSLVEFESYMLQTRENRVVIDFPVNRNSERIWLTDISVC